VIDNGLVVEQGTHQELIRAGGKYEALAKNQQAGEQEENSLPPTLLKSISSRVAHHSDKADAVDVKKAEDTPTEAINYTGVKKKKKVGNKQKLIIIRRLLMYNKPDILWLLFGMLISLCNGIIYPLISLLLSNMIINLSQPMLPGNVSNP